LVGSSREAPLDSQRVERHRQRELESEAVWRRGARRGHRRGRGASRGLGQRAGAVSGIGFDVDSPDVSLHSRCWRRKRQLSDRAHAGLWPGSQRVVVRTAMLARSSCRALTKARPEDVSDESEQVAKNEQKRATRADTAHVPAPAGWGLDRDHRKGGDSAVCARSRANSIFREQFVDCVHGLRGVLWELTRSNHAAQRWRLERVGAARVGVGWLLANLAEVSARRGSERCRSHARGGCFRIRK